MGEHICRIKGYIFLHFLSITNIINMVIPSHHLSRRLSIQPTLIPKLRAAEKDSQYQSLSNHTRAKAEPSQASFKAKTDTNIIPATEPEPVPVPVLAPAPPKPPWTPFSSSFSSILSPASALASPLHFSWSQSSTPTGASNPRTYIRDKALLG